MDADHATMYDLRHREGRAMRLAVVHDQPSQSRTTMDMVQRALRMLRLDVDLTLVPATTATGSKTPGIKQVREDQSDFWERLERARPDRVLAMGPLSLTQMERSHDKLRITDARGIMRRAESPTGWRTLYVPTGSAGGIVAYPDMFRDLIDDLHKLLLQTAPMARLEPHDGHVQWETADEPAVAFALLHGLTGYDVPLSCDIETTGFDPWRDEVTQVGFGVRIAAGRSRVVIVKDAALADPDVQDAMWHLVFSASHTTVLHNAKFDLKFLLRLLQPGERAPHGARIADTMLLHHMLDERPVGKMAGSVHSLKTLARVYYDQEDYALDHEAHNRKRREGTLTRDEIDAFDWYHARDCHFTIQLYHDMRDETEDRALLDHHDELLGPVSLVFAEAELFGAPIDRARLAAFKDTLTGRIDATRASLMVSDRFAALGSSDAIMDHLVGGYGVDRALFGSTARGKGRTEPGRESADRGTLVNVKRRHPEAGPFVDAILAYREDTKSLGTYVQPLLQRTERRPRVSATFWLAGTVTGRISSSDPNLQNIPARHGENVREAFAAEPGHVWVEVDYSQLELRVAAMLSGDPWFGELFKSGRDVHAEVASAIFAKPVEEVSKAERFIAKSVDFGILYGRTAWAIANDETIRAVLEADGKPPITEASAEVFVKAFLAEYPTLRRWLEDQQARAMRDGWVPVGRRRRRFLYQNRDRNDHNARQHIGEVRRQAMNSPIQGVASDITLSAMVRIAPHLPDGAMILFPVHDSICLHVDERLLDETIALVREGMTTPPAWLDSHGVPLEVDVKIGPDWGSTK